MPQMHWKFARLQPQPKAPGALAPLRWDAIKALQLAPPVVVKRVELPLVRDEKGNVVGWVNRAYRRRAQRRFRGVPVFASSPRAARLTPVDRNGQAASLTANRVARRLAVAAEREAAAA